MATARMQPEAGVDVANLASLFLGKNSSQNTTQQNSGSVNTSGTVTTSESVSPEAVNAVVKSILEGNQGLAAVAGGEKRAGLYNSSTNQMLVNDLIARSAAEGAKLNRSQTVTTNNVQADNRAVSTNQVNATKAQVNPGKTAAVLGGLQLLPTDAKNAVLGKLGLGKGAKAGTTGANAAQIAPTAPTDINAAIDSASIEAGAPTMANNPSAFVAGMNPSEAGQNIQSIGSNMDSQSIESFLGGFENGSDGIDLGGFNANVDVGADVGSNIDMSGSIDTSNLGYDPSFDFEGFDQEFGNFDLGFAEGGKVSKESLFERRKAALDSAEDAAVKGEDANTEYQNKLKTGTKGEGKEKTKTFIQRLIPQFAEGGIVKLKSYVVDERGRKNAYSDPRSSKHVPEFQDPAEGEAGTDGYSSSKGKPRVPRYASGGMVDLTNTGLRKTSPEYASPMGVGSNSQAVSRPSTGTKSTNTASLNNASSGSTPARANIKLYEPAPTGESDATDNGVGIAGAGGMGLSSGEAGALGLGMGAIGLGGGSIGLANASNNNQAVNSVVSGIASAIGGPIAGLVVSALMSNVNAGDSTGVGSDLSPGSVEAATGIAGVNNGGLAGLGVTLGLDDFGGGGYDPGAVGVGEGGWGSDLGGAGDIGSGGDAGGDSGGDAGYKQGGEVNGPGTSTSDSIVARLSDGEFVHKASAVQTFGEPFMEAVNNEDPVKALELLLTSGLIKSGPKSKGKK